MRRAQSPYRTQASPIRIGDNVWIGAGTLVMPGVTIGDGTTIGAGSLVTRDIPASVLAFGQPRKAPPQDPYGTTFRTVGYSMPSCLR